MLPLPGRGNGRCRGFGHDYENDSVQVSPGRYFLPSGEVTADWYPGGAEVNPGLRRRVSRAVGGGWAPVGVNLGSGKILVMTSATLLIDQLL